MKTKTKVRILTFILTLCLGMALLPLTAFAADAKQVTGVSIDFTPPQVGNVIGSYVSVSLTPEQAGEEMVVITQWSIVENEDMVDISEEQCATTAFEAGKTYHLHLGLVMLNSSDAEVYSFACEAKDVLVNGEAAPDNTIWFPESNVLCFDKDFEPLPADEDADADNPFTDVPDGAYFHDAVLWAAKNGVTKGTTETTFSPSATCTRGQVVTFLWRALGCPEPSGTNNPFTDVKNSDYYYKAVLWAVEKGITVGTSVKTFSPNNTCTSAQIITFLWRANGKPAATASSALAASNSGQYYTDAIAWADSKGILRTDDPFGFTADADSPRADIVTYLYRNAQ